MRVAGAVDDRVGVLRRGSLGEVGAGGDAIQVGTLEHQNDLVVVEPA